MILRGCGKKGEIAGHSPRPFSSAAPSQKLKLAFVSTIAAGRQPGELIKEAIPQGGKTTIFAGKMNARGSHLTEVREYLNDNALRLLRCFLNP